VGEIELCYETFGPADGPALLLVMGLGSQMIVWQDEFCDALARHGYRVIRFDNRDVGRSTILRDAPIPTRLQLLRRDSRAVSYTLEDMAGDAVGLLDDLEIGSAHVVGASMGGMIAQLMAIHHGQRVRSLVSIMSSTGSRRVGQAHPRLLPRLSRRPRLDREGYIAEFGRTCRAVGSKRYQPAPDRLRTLAARTYDRGHHPAGTARQLAAILAARDRTPRLRQLRLPSTVVHGAADPLVLPSGGRATAQAIPDARLVMLDDMGHDMPRELWPQIIEPIVQVASAAS
jgi:pimeloyl-ACP methyl ester carboxylesterase